MRPLLAENRPFVNGSNRPRMCKNALMHCRRENSQNFVNSKNTWLNSSNLSRH
jgi:hypothetical protein